MHLVNIMNVLCKQWIFCLFFFFSSAAANWLALVLAQSGKMSYSK